MAMAWLPALRPLNVGARRALSSWAPPGLLRLGLAPERLRSVQRAAREQGPSIALGLLTKHQELSLDPAQRDAAHRLDVAWRAAHAYTKDYLEWQRRHVQWREECARLEAEHEAKRAAKTAKAAMAKEPKEADPGPELPPEPPRPGLKNKGFYLWGQVGRGKTLLMDIFALSLKEDSAEAGAVLQRVHFHEFTHSLHRRLHKLRQEGAKGGISDAVDEVARGCPAVLCFDEFQLTTIADATLLAPLFGELLNREMILVVTSNRPPEELYREGLQRENLLPAFEALLRSSLEVHQLDAATDYRQARVVSSDGGDFQVGEGQPGSAFGAAEQCEVKIAWGRTMQCQVAGGVGKFTFEELCGTPLSSEDYLALIRGGLHTFVVSDVPRFDLKLHNEARRFTNLVDALYEHQCRLVCFAETSIDNLLTGMDSLCSAELEPDQPAMGIGGSEKSLRRYVHGDVSFEASEASPCRPDTFATAEADAEAGTSCLRLTKSGDASDTQDSIAGVMSAAVDSLRETGFAARRCTSRLHEMNSETYRQGHMIRWGIPA